MCKQKTDDRQWQIDNWDADGDLQTCSAKYLPMRISIAITETENANFAASVCCF